MVSTKGAHMEFSEISSIEELKQYLEDKGKGHRPFFHYTTLETLQGMLKNRRLFLTRMDKLNDAMECNAAPERKKRVYIASFSFGRPESVAMWYMYGTPSKKGIRLTIPNRAITQTINGFEKNPVIFSTETGKEITTEQIPVLKMIDVVYAHNGSLEHNKEKLLRKQGEFVITAKADPELAFFVKNEIWLSENETRMVLEFEKELPGDLVKVAIDFDYAINNLEITANPCFNQKDIIAELKDFEKDRIHQSCAYNHVYFRECNGCGRKTDFCKKNKKENGK